MHENGVLSCLRNMFFYHPMVVRNIPHDRCHCLNAQTDGSECKLEEEPIFSTVVGRSFSAPC